MRDCGQREPTYNLTVSDEQGPVERVLAVVDGARGLLGGLLVLAIAIAAMRAGGAAGWALAIALLLALGSGLVVTLRRHR